MGINFKIAKRYLIGKKSTNAIHVLSIISLIAMTVGTMALILVLSVYNGFEGLVLSLYDSFRADIVLVPEKGKTYVASAKMLADLNENEDIKAYSLVLEENALFDYDGKPYFARLKGIDENYLEVNPIDTCIVEGRFKIDQGRGFAVLGLGVAKALSMSLFDDFGSLRVFMPRRGEKINTINPMESVNIRDLKPMGYYSIEKEFDSKYVFVALDYAQNILEQTNKISGIEIVLDDPKNIRSVQKSLNNILPENIKALNRFEIDSTIYKVMKGEKFVAYLLLSFILLIAAFNIIGSLSMLVFEKRKDINILQAMGASANDIYKIFLSTGLMLSLGGALLGFVLAIIIGLIQIYLQPININASGNFLIDALPVTFRLNDFLLIGLTVVVIGLLASYFPARNAAQQALVFRD